jgi:hypothetical protein
MTLKISDNGVLRDATPEELAQHELDVAVGLARRAEHERTKYQRDRAAEYPSMADYLDGIVKGDQAQVQTYIDACLTVKTKYPKP